LFVNHSWAFFLVRFVTNIQNYVLSGFVGSGGNVGSVVYGIGFLKLGYQAAFIMMGSIVIASSFLSVLIHIPCHAGLLWGEDNNTVLQSRERYRLKRERARQAIEEQHQARIRGGRRDGEVTVEGGATVESIEKVERGSDGAEVPEETQDAPTPSEESKA
jgi:hypothetical protein